MKKVVFSGKFLMLPINGIPRYAMEVIKELDKIVEYGLVELCYPERLNKKSIPNLKNIKCVPLKGKIIQGWDILYAEKYAKQQKALFINLCSKGILYSKSIVCIHDIRPLTWDKENKVKSRKNIALKYNFYQAVHKPRKIVSVSNFSKKEICDYYQIDSSKIIVIPNGWEHINEIIDDVNIFRKFPDINKKKYYFAIGSLAPHKNFEWILNIAANHPQEQFVISGAINKNIWNYDINFEKIRNVIFTNYVSDAEMKALMKNAKALLFPSFYEGFGIPPLEALALNIPVFASNLPVLKEVYKDTIRYFNPYNYNICLDDLWEQKISAPFSVLNKYTWKSAARQWYDLVSH